MDSNQNKIVSKRANPLLFFIFILIFLFAYFYFFKVPQVKALAPTSGLVGYWNFDEGSGTTAKDTSGNANDGIITGATWTAGKVGSGALDFVAGTNHVSIPQSSSINNLNSFTYSAWINPRVTTLGSVVYKKGILRKFISVADSIGSNFWALIEHSNTDATISTDKNSVEANVWQLVTLTYNGNTKTASFYKNGILLKTSTGNGSSAYDSPGDFIIGNNDLFNNGFNGKIDDVRIYNREITASEVLDIYNDTSGQSGQSCVAGTPVPLISSITPTSLTASSVTISWTTYENSNSQVEYGTSDDEYDLTSSLDPSLVTSHSVLLSNLSGNTLYHYRVKSKDSSDNLVLSGDNTFTTSVAVGDNTPPSVPTSFSAAAVSSSAINLSWTASTDNVGVSGYKIYRGGKQIGTSVANNYSDSGLTSSTSYSYNVSANDAAFNNSAESSASSATTQAGTAPPSTVSDTLTIAETSGQNQNGRPFTIGRVFAKGEISNFPRPSVSGSPLATWQADVKTRWRDGSATCSVTNVTNTSPMIVTCASAHGWLEGEQVTLLGISGNTAANGTWWITPLTANTFNLHGSTGSGNYSGGGTATGPADGSVQHAIISFNLTLPANSKTQVGFVNSSNPCSSGSQAQCLAAAVTKTQLQNWDIGSGAGNWNATIDLTNGSTKTVDSKTILNACASISTDITSLSCRYWLAGPVVSQIVVEDRSPARAFDTGFATNNPIHPAFIMTAYNGYSGLKVDYIMENTWVGNADTGMQMVDDAYQVVMKKGATPTAFYTYPTTGTFNHWARTRYRETAWQGNQPGSVWIDYNMPYYESTGASYNYDTSFTLPASYWDPNNTNGYNSVGGFSEVNLFNQSDGGKDPNAMGSLTTRSYGDGGAHAEYGLDDRFDVAWMYSWAAGLIDPNARLMENVIAGNSEVLSHVNIHYRENLTGRTFCNATNNCIAAGQNTADAYGRPVSIDSRPNMWYYAQNSAANNSASSSDRLPITGIQVFDPNNIYTLKGWNYELSHAWDIDFHRYLMTGDYYLLEELWFQPDLALAARSPDNAQASRGGAFGFTFDENRGGAWAMKFLSRAAFASPTGTPEKLFFQEKLANNLAVREGWYGITNGAFYEPGVGSRWNFGRNTQANNQPNPLAMQFPPECYYSSAWQDPTKSYSNLQTWTQNLNSAVSHEIADMGFSSAKPGADNLSEKHLLHQILDPAYNPYLIGVEEEPVTVGDNATCGNAWPSSGHPFITDWATAKATFTPSTQARTTFVGSSSQGAEWNYSLIGLVASSFLPGLTDGGLDGTTAYNWMKANVPDQDLTHMVPRLAIVPRASAVGLPNTGGIYNFGNFNLRLGSRGEAVRELQRFLNQTLNINLKVDGIFGKSTLVALIEWQENNGLNSDGVVGAKTKASMNKN